MALAVSTFRRYKCWYNAQSTGKNKVSGLWESLEHKLFYNIWAWFL